MDLVLQRVFQQSECTAGSIEFADFKLDTLELPWIPEAAFPGGAPDRSCVPAGFYSLELHDTVKHPKTWALVNRDLGVIHEPDATFPNARVACLLHVANWPSELLGCIGVGMNSGNCTIGQSQVALALLKRNMPWIVGNTLTIMDPP